MSLASVQGAGLAVDTLHGAAVQLAGLEAVDHDAAQLIAGKVQDTAPRETGYLAEHVTADGGQVVVGAPYAVFVNARDPWVSRARDAVLDDVTDLYARATRAALE